MASNAIKSDFGSSKMAAGHFEKKVAFWSEMARNMIKIDFRSSKMAAGGHFKYLFQKQEKLRFYLKWRVMQSRVISVIQNGRRQPFWKKKKKSWVFIWNGE